MKRRWDGGRGEGEEEEEEEGGLIKTRNEPVRCCYHRIV